jgi:hypothetical protein
MAAVSAELNRKRQEAVFLKASETDRVDRQEEAAAARVGGRQAAPASDESSDVVIKHKRRSK